MSILFRLERELPLLELARMWALELSDTSREQLLLALVQAGLDGVYDETYGESRPGLYRRRNADPSRLDGPIDSYTLRGELAGPPHRLVVPERFAESLVISKAAVVAFAERRRLPLPKCWAPERPGQKQKHSGGRRSVIPPEALIEVGAWLHAARIPEKLVDVEDKLREAIDMAGAAEPAESTVREWASKLVEAHRRAVTK